MNALSRFALYLVAVIVLPWLALGLAGTYFNRKYCHGGDCNILIVPIFGVGILVFLAAAIGCAMVEFIVRRRSRR